MARGSRASGCTRCRKRKFKCDRKTPTCSRCESLNIDCVYPDKFHFVDIEQTSLETQAAVTKPTATRSVTAVYSKITETPIENGGLFQKWHQTRLKRTASSMNPALSLNRDEKRSQAVVACFEYGHSGIQPHWLGEWMKLIPQRIGTSNALDHAAQFMSTVHQALLRGQTPSFRVPAYIEAIKSLREALADPKESYSAETLASTAILYYLEALFGLDYNFVLHAGGVARLLEVRGPSNVEVGFENLLVSRLYGIAISQAVQMGVPCFLANKSWRSRIVNAPADSVVLKLYKRVWLLMLDWSDFAIKVREFCTGSLSQEATLGLLSRILQAQTALSSLDATMEECCSSNEYVQRVKSIRKDSPFQSVLNFTDYQFSGVVVFHACYSLVLFQMLGYLCQNDAQKRTLSKTPGVQTQKLLNRILQSYEYAWKHHPFGATGIIAPLLVAYPLVEEEGLKDWIAQALNDLDSHLNFKQPRYTTQSILYMAGILTGKYPSIKLPSP